MAIHLRVAGGPFTENVYREIEALTDGSRTTIGSANHDPDHGTVTIPITRFDVAQKRGWLARLKPYRRAKAPVPSKIIIRNVVSCEIRHHKPASPPIITEVTLIFGVTVRGNVVTLGSVEEDRGKTIYEVVVHVSRLDIEIVDAEEYPNTAQPGRALDAAAPRR